MSPWSELVLKYLRILVIAFFVVIPGFSTCLAHRFTAKLMSGLVQTAAYSSSPTRDLYQVLSMGSPIEIPVRVLTAPGSIGILFPLHLVIPCPLRIPWMDEFWCSNKPLLTFSISIPTILVISPSSLIWKALPMISFACCILARLLPAIVMSSTYTPSMQKSSLLRTSVQFSIREYCLLFVWFLPLLTKIQGS